MKIDIIPSQRIFYLRRIGGYGQANKELMTAFKERVKAENLFDEETTIYGIAWSEPNTPKEKCIYDVCVVVSVEQNSIEGMEETILENGKYAIFKVNHTGEAVQEFWMTFMKPDFQKKHSITIDFKRPILEKYAVNQIETGYCEFCVPIN